MGQVSHSRTFHNVYLLFNNATENVLVRAKLFSGQTDDQVCFDVFALFTSTFPLHIKVGLSSRVPVVALEKNTNTKAGPSIKC